MQGLYQLNATITHFLEGFLETAVPMIAGLAEVVGLFIIITSLGNGMQNYLQQVQVLQQQLASGQISAEEYTAKVQQLAAQNFGN